MKSNIFECTSAIDVVNLILNNIFLSLPCSIDFLPSQNLENMMLVLGMYQLNCIDSIEAPFVCVSELLHIY